jgi:antibiotic biosynthesis monooxygenase (ABM) superfamily enzyme
MTATVTRRIEPGHEAAYEEFLADISRTAKGFHGYLGEEVFRPASGEGGEYQIVYRFDSTAHLRRWLDSNERAAWLKRRATTTARSPTGRPRHRVLVRQRHHHQSEHLLPERDQRQRSDGRRALDR